jgi:hypothetical protein
MPYRIGQLRARAFYKRSEAGDLRRIATTLSSDDDRNVFLRDAANLERDAGLLEEQASRLVEEAQARRRKTKATSSDDR